MQPFPRHYRDPEPTSLGDDLHLRLLHLGGLTIEPTWEQPDMAAPFWRFYANLDSGAAVVCRGRRIALTPGRLWVIPAWLPWSSRCQGSVRHANLHLDVLSFPQEAVTAVVDSPLDLGQPDLAAELADLATRLALQPAPRLEDQLQGHLLASRCLLALLAALDEDDRGRLWQPVRHNPLAPLLDHIERNLDGDLGNPRLATRAQCSVAQLDRWFRRHLQTTPARYVRQRRLARAADLLTATDLPLEEVATRCGLGDRRQLTRVFQTGLGLGPGQYRRRR